MNVRSVINRLYHRDEQSESQESDNESSNKNGDQDDASEINEETSQTSFGLNFKLFLRKKKGNSLNQLANQKIIMENENQSNENIIRPDFFLKYAIIMTFTSIIVAVILIFWSTAFFPGYSWIHRTLSNLGSVTRGFEYTSAPLLMQRTSLQG